MAHAKPESNLYQRATERLAKGDLPQAIDLFESHLQRSPDDAAAQCGYALALSRSSRFDEASRAIRVDPARVERLRGKLNSNAELKVGIAIFADDTPSDADCPSQFLQPLTDLPQITLYNLQPRPITPLTGLTIVNLADACKDFADVAAAISQLDLVIAADTSAAHLAGALAKPVWLLLDHTNAWPWSAGRDDAPKYPAMRIFRQPRPGDWASVANAVRHALKREITIRNAPASEWNKLASTFLTQSRYTEAEAAARRALAKEPNSASIHLNLAAALHQQNRIEEAITHYEQSLTYAPDWPRALSNLSDAYARAAKMEEAESAARRAVALDPNSAGFHGNLAAVLVRRGQPEEAEQCARRALAIKPDDPRGHLNLAAALLDQNRYEEAWPHYEWRPNARSVSNPSRILWQGEDLKGRTIILRAEQGAGDNIMLIRYATMLRKLNPAKIIVECNPELIDLLKTFSDVDEVRESPNLAAPLAGRSSPADFEIAMMSLPHRFNTTPTTIPADVRYVRAAEDRIQRLEPHVRKSPNLKIALIWSGNPLQGNNRQRSMPASNLLPLNTIAKVDFYSLQKGEAADRDRAIMQELKMTDLAPQLQDFADLAAAMSLVDLIITTDTGPANLASALGLPTWTLLSHAPDWRWQRNRTDSPWYPSMRLFRQPKPFDWEAVVAQVVAALADRLQSHPT